MSADNLEHKDFYFFMYTADNGKRKQTTYRLTLVDAAERFAGRDPEPVASSREVRQNLGSLNTGMFMRPPVD